MLASKSDRLQEPVNLIDTFARSQLTQVRRQSIRESTLLELLTCAFFVGAEQRLRKQSDLSTAQSIHTLHQLIMTLCRLGEIKAAALTGSVNELAKKYYLVESIIEQGERAAEQWLNCDEANDPALLNIISKYQNLTMYELGIEGVNKKYLAQQDALFNSTKDMVHRLRMRAMGFILVLAGAAAVACYFYDPFHLF